MIFAHFVALRMYRAALIQDIFMVQDRSVADVSDDEKPVGGEQDVDEPLAEPEADKSKSE